MSPIIHLVIAPDKTQSDAAAITQIQIDQLRTIVQNICDLNKEEQVTNDLTSDKIVLAIKGQPAMKSIGQKSHATGFKLKKEEIGMSG
eukprot:13720336-Ditylum_brightwellii.AAC.1